MSQQLQSLEIQQKQQLIYSLSRDVARNEIENTNLLFKIGIIQDEIKQLKKDEVVN